jgi:hypothetical protein
VKSRHPLPLPTLLSLLIPLLLAVGCATPPPPTGPLPDPAENPLRRQQ